MQTNLIVCLKAFDLLTPKSREISKAGAERHLPHWKAPMATSFALDS